MVKRAIGGHLVQPPGQILANFNAVKFVVGVYLVGYIQLDFFLYAFVSLLFTLLLCTSKRNLAWPPVYLPIRLLMRAQKPPLSLLEMEQTQLSASPSMPYISAPHYLGGSLLDLMSSSELALICPLVPLDGLLVLGSPDLERLIQNQTSTY